MQSAPDLAAFVPWTVFDLVEAALTGRESRKSVEGTVLFCDVAGFTPLTEALAAIGREGSEELTRVLNGYFTVMIDIIGAEGGDVLRFGGDAMTVLFPGRSPRAALRAADRMMAAMAPFAALATRAGTFAISMKIGAAHGTCHLGIVGDDALGRDYYAAGAPIDDSAAAEHHASPGEVVRHASIPRRSPRAAAPPPRPAPPEASQLARLVPGFLAERAAVGAAGEHRGTAVVFASVTGLADEPARLHRDVAALHRSAASAARRHGGVVNKLDMGDKGAKAILLFGAPRAIEQREEMAVRAALELRARLPDGMAIAAGVTSAPLFSGPVGAPGRRELTVMGDGINMAARLMQAAAAGQILCDAACATAAGDQLNLEALRAITVKGRRAPIAIWEARGERERVAARRGALIERDEVLASAVAYLTGSGEKPLALVGGAGLGKSALLDHLQIEVAARGANVTRVALAPFHRDQPFAAWSAMIRDVAGITRSVPRSTLSSARERLLAAEPVGHRPLLNPLLGLPEETTSALRVLAPKERRDLTFAVVERLLAQSDPRVLLLDNLHWADPLSLELLDHLLPEAGDAPWRLVATIRPGGETARAMGSSLRTMELHPLGASGVAELLRTQHGIVDLPEPVLTWFVDRSRGVPSVVAALVRAAAATGLMERDVHGARLDEDRLLEAAFPDTLEGLYLAQVDRLPRVELEVLQAASIVGATVSLNLLEQVAGRDRLEMVAELEALDAAGLLRPDTRGSRAYLVFPDTLLRDAVYGALAFARKRQGHLRIAELLEHESAEDRRVWPALAHHLSMADEPERARDYFRRAGRDAVDRYDNQSALHLLEPVCRTLTADPDDVDDAFRLLDVYDTLGRWNDGRPLLRRLLPIQKELAIGQRCRLQNFTSRDLAARANWKGVETALLRGLALAREAGDPLLVLKARLNLSGRLYGPTGRIAEAEEQLRLALAEARDPAASSLRAAAASNLGIVLLLTGRADEGISLLETTYRSARRAGLGPLLGQIATNLTGLHCEAGRFAMALRWAERAVAVLDTFAMRQQLLQAKVALAQNQVCLGQAAAVVEAMPEVARRAAALEQPDIEGEAREKLAQALALEGDLDGALAEMRTALRIHEAAGNTRGFAVSLGSLGGLLLAIGDLDQARWIWNDVGAERFLSAGAVDPLAHLALARQHAMIAGTVPHRERPDAFLREAEEGPAEERLERLLWTCEGALEDGRDDAARRHLETVSEALPACPHHEARVRAARIDLLLNGTAPPASLLRQCRGGVWGLRLSCELSARGKRVARRRAGDALEFVRRHAASWAWDRIGAYPEVAAVLGRDDVTTAG